MLPTEKIIFIEQEVLEDTKEEIHNTYPVSFDRLEEDLKVIKFDSPLTKSNYMEFVIKNNHIFITGAAGEAIFRIPENQSLEFFKDMKTREFIKYAVCHSFPLYTLDNDIAAQQVKQWFLDKADKAGGPNQLWNAKSVFDELMEAVNCNVIQGAFKDDVDAIRREYKDHFNIGEFIQMYSYGAVINKVFHSYLAGLQIAYEITQI